MRKWDVKAILPVTGVEITYECKRDRKTWHTGNIYVEHKALLHSEADLYVYLLDKVSEALFAIPRTKLLSLLIENYHVHHTWPIVFGGEDNNRGTLLPKDVYFLFSRTIN